MTAHPLFYGSPIALDSQVHRKLKIKLGDDGLTFSRKTNSVLLAGAEFPEACKHFPIAFTKIAERAALPVAVLGFRDRENLFVDASGKWVCEYVPAYIRRYPFALGDRGDGQSFTVCIDEAYAGFNADEGQPLFDASGEPTEYLKSALAFLQDYQAQMKRTDGFLNTLWELDLFKEFTANLNAPDGARHSIAGLMMVDAEKLQSLPDVELLRLARSGELAWIYSHLISISNFDRMPLLAKKEITRVEGVPASPGKTASGTQKAADQGERPVKR
jgi:hypothetical protein